MPSLIPVRKLAELCDPFSNPWTGRPFKPRDVNAAIAEGRLNPKPWSKEEGKKWPRKRHIERIAYLAVHGWDASVDIDVGVPSLGCIVRWPVQDGNHRLAAAIVRGDESIQAEVGGDIRYANELFGNGVMAL